MAFSDMKKKAHLIFIPSPGAGHIFSALEFADILTNRFNHLSITVLAIKFPSTTSSPSHTTSVLASQPQIQLIDVPEPELPPQDLGLKARGIVITAFMESLIPQVKAIVENILSSSNHKSDSNPVVCLVLDFLCFPLINVGEELGIPSYIYVTSNAGFLSFILSLQKRRIDDVFDYSDPDHVLPGFSTLVPSRVLPDLAFSSDGGYLSCHRLAQRFKDTKGIIINTFSDLENYAIDALLSDDGKTKTPPIYTVGPLIDLKGQHNPNLDQSQDDKILKWLDEQPDASVIFLCFGSRGSFGPSQTREIALALQSSGIKFLWAISSSSPTKVSDERILPEGFLEWMEGKGMICEWAPQVKVLAHKAIGGFVSHCGWNSILESLWFGVPILTWPIYAEQQLNAFRMVKEFGLAVELKLDYRSGSSDLVMADEIEKGMNQLMDRENDVHKKVQEIKEMARKAVHNGGSSFISIAELIDNMIGNK